MDTSRRVWAPLTVGLLLGALLLAACGGSSTPAPTATTLLQQASDTFAKDTSLQFTLTADNIAPGAYAVTQATGAVVRPDKLKIDGSDEVTQGFQAAIGIIFIGSDQYVDIAGTGKYIKTSGLPNLLAIFDANNGIGAILQQVQNPSTPTAETIANTATWKITGTVTSAVLAPITSGSTTSSNPIQTTLWIGQSDHQVYEVKLVGNAVDGDSATTTRTFTLSKFNMPVTIDIPPLR